MKDDENDLGEPSPVYLKDGTRKDRKCRDFLCLIIFLFFIFYYILLFFEMIVIDFKFEKFSVPHDPDRNYSYLLVCSRIHYKLIN